VNPELPLPLIDEGPSRNRKTPTPLAKYPGRFLGMAQACFFLPEYVEAQPARNDTAISFQMQAQQKELDSRRWIVV
jgi:hypothetical protein